MKDRIKTSISELILDENDIVHMRFDNNAKINFDQSREIFFSRMKLNSASEQQLLLVDLRNNPRPDKEARLYAKSAEVRRTTKAMAIMTDDQFGFILRNLFLGEHKFEFPVRMFTDKTKAISWLMTQRDMVLG